MKSRKPSHKTWKRILQGAFLVPLLLLVSGMLISSCSTRLTALPTGEDLTYQNLLEWSHENGMPGAVLLVQTPAEQFLGSVGYADLKRRIPMRTDRAFPIGSVTKSFVGLVCAQMHAEGKLDLDSSVTHLLPSTLTDRLPQSKEMTLRQLLEHRSGLPDFTRSNRRNLSRAFLDRRGSWSPERELAYIYDQALLFEPGQDFSYSSTGYLLAGLILDAVTGHHHSKEIRARILNPLQLTNSWYLTVEPAKAAIPRGYEDWFFWWRTDATEWTPATGGGAGLASTAHDLARFLRAVAGDSDWLEEEVHQILLGNWSEEKQDYFLGVQRVRSRKDAPWFLGHSGAVPGYHCFAFHQPKSDITIVFFGSSGQLTPWGNQRLDRFYKALRNQLFDLALRRSQS